MGIDINPSARVITTDKSVAGRGVFAVEDIAKGEKIALIPTYMFIHPANGEALFPETAAALRQRRRRQDNSSNNNNKSAERTCDSSLETMPGSDPEKEGRKGWLRRLKGRLFQRKQKHPTITTILSNGNNRNEEQQERDRKWQVELTEYALAALKSDHPLSPWIQQWQRDDPVRRMFQRGVTTLDNQNAIAETVVELQQQVPDLPRTKIMAALGIRLEQYYQSFAPFFVSDPNATETVDMYNLCTSRTLDLAEDVTAIVPFHDMINHSFEPNVGLAISDDGQHLKLFAMKDVTAGKEMFLCYTKYGKEYSEDAAVWMLVQWGIPVARADWKVVHQSES